MDKQKSYGENYQQVKLKHKLCKRFYFLTGLACAMAVACVAILGFVL